MSLHNQIYIELDKTHLKTHEHLYCYEDDSRCFQFERSSLSKFGVAASLEDLRIPVGIDRSNFMM